MMYQEQGIVPKQKYFLRSDGLRAAIRMFDDDDSRLSLREFQERMRFNPDKLLWFNAQYIANLPMTNC